jgi:hypothetical protein
MASRLNRGGTLVTVEGSGRDQNSIALKRALQDQFEAAWDRSSRAWTVPTKYADAALTHLATARVVYASRPDADANGVAFEFRASAGSVATASTAAAIEIKPAARKNSRGNGGGGGGGERSSPMGGGERKARSRSRSRTRSRSPPPVGLLRWPTETQTKRTATPPSPPKPKKKKPASRKPSEEKKAKKPAAKKKKPASEAALRAVAAATPDELVTGVRKDALLGAYHHLVKRVYRWAFSPGQPEGGKWGVYELDKKPVRDVRRQVAKWLAAYPGDADEFLAEVARSDVADAAKKVARKKPTKKSGGGGGGGGGEAKESDADALARYVTKVTKPELVAWLLARDRRDRLSETKKHYTDQGVSDLRALVVQRADGDAAAVNKLRAAYDSATINARSKLEEKRADTRAAADQELELLRLTARWLTPGRRFALQFTGRWTVYDQSDAAHRNHASATVEVEVVRYTPDAKRELALARGKLGHHEEIPDSRLVLTVLGEVDVFPPGESQPYLRLKPGSVIELATGNVHQHAGKLHPEWQYPAEGESRYGSSLTAEIDAAAILAVPAVHHAIVRSPVDRAMRQSTNYHGAISDLVADYA